MSTVESDDIYSNMPAAKEPANKKHKKDKMKKKSSNKKKKKGIQDTPLKPPPEKGILKCPTPITTTPDGKLLCSVPNDVNTSKISSAIVELQEIPHHQCIGPSMPAHFLKHDAQTHGSVEQKNDKKLEGQTDELDESDKVTGTASREKALLAEIALIKARMATKKKQNQQSLHKSKTGVHATTNTGKNSASLFSSSGRKRHRVSFLMDQPKKKVTVNIAHVLKRIEKVC